MEKYEKTGWVNDFANILTEGERELLTQKLDKLHNENKVNLVIVTTPSLNDKTIADWTIELALRWKVGKKGEDNGMIYVIAPNERKWRIEVGYGLEGQFPDGKISSIGDLSKEHFKSKAYYNGINTVVTRIIGEVSGDKTLIAVTTPASTGTSRGWIIFWIIVIVVVIIIIIACSDSSSGGYGSGSSGGYSSSGGFFSSVVGSFSSDSSSSSGGSDSGGDFLYEVVAVESNSGEGLGA